MTEALPPIPPYIDNCLNLCPAGREIMPSQVALRCIENGCSGPQVRERLVTHKDDVTGEVLETQICFAVDCGVTNKAEGIVERYPMIYMRQSQEEIRDRFKRESKRD